MPLTFRRLRRSVVLFLLLTAACGGRRPAPAGFDGAPAPVARPVVPPPPAPPPPPPPLDLAGYRTAIDLVANRIHAVSHREGRLVIDAGSPDFLKYIDGNWKTSWYLTEKDQGKPAALVANISSLLFVPIDCDGDGVGAGAGRGAPGDTLLSFTGRALAPKQKVTIFANEKPVATLELDGIAKRHDVTIPAAALKNGDNRLRLTFHGAGMLAGGRRSAAAVTRFALGPASLGPATFDPAPVVARDVDVGGTRKRALAIPGNGSRLSFYLQVPEAARLAMAVAAPGGAADVLVRVAVDGQPARIVYEGHAGKEWADAAADLGLAAGRAARIDLIARGGEVVWGDPRVVVKAAPRPTTGPGKRFDHIFVWMVDTLRADKMHVYNPRTRVQTPNYDAFAADATRFEWAQVPGTWSLPSHASLLTGVYPSVHKAVAHEARLSRDVPFVAEEMKKAGYKTAMFSSNGYISSKWGFDRGWDAYRNFIRESLPNGADYLWKTAKPWVMSGLRKPQFAYLATVEPHVIYNPKKQFLIKYWNKPYKGPIKPAKSGVQLGFIKSGKLKINDNDKAYLEALHDGEITESDAIFATFIADLKSSGLYDRSAVIVVSDHGDEFWEHGSLGHGHSVYQELVRIPLIIRAPGVFPQGKVVGSDVEVMDLYATMLELAGIKPGAGVQGTSLIGLAADEIGRSPRAAFTIDGQIARGLKVARYRLVHLGGQRIELYDELDDRREQKNLAADHPIALRQMRNVFGILYGYEQRWNKSRWGTAANVTPEFWKDNGG
ncbi:MAG TPA: sulfatase [Polyangia bacterium]|nr:sulfatase [Polyangia bacterium]